MNTTKVHSAFSGLVDKTLKTLSKSGLYGASSALSGAEIMVGPDTDGNYQIDGAAAVNPPMFVGDSAYIGQERGMTSDIAALLKNDPLSVGYHYQPRYYGNSLKYDLEWSRSKKGVGDSVFVGDSAGQFINGSLLSPNGMNWITEVIKQPLAWSDARSLVKIVTGNNPWANAQFLPVAAYSGFGTINTSGNLDNGQAQDIEIQSGLLAQTIINIEVTYKLSLQELEQSKAYGNEIPYSGQLIAEKEKYAQWVKNTLTDAIIYYGNAATNTTGLLNVNSVGTWTAAGYATLTSIDADSANVNKGSTAYQQLAAAVTDFLTTLQNQVGAVKIRMSPLAYNKLGRMPYSNVYNPESALKILVENFMSGIGKTGAVPNIEIKADPMLAATTGGVVNLFNSTAHDYLIITADSIPAGPDETPESLLWFGAPLMDFMYPVVPQMSSTQYRSVRRVSGVFAPLSTATKAYSAYGI
jgi:hypothetical protein